MVIVELKENAMPKKLSPNGQPTFAEIKSRKFSFLLSPFIN